MQWFRGLSSVWPVPPTEVRPDVELRRFEMASRETLMDMLRGTVRAVVEPGRILVLVGLSWQIVLTLGGLLVRGSLVVSGTTFARQKVRRTEALGTHHPCIHIPADLQVATAVTTQTKCPLACKP